MYKKINRDQICLDDYITQFGGKLRKDNRWVKMSEMIPWEAIEDIYAKNFTKNSGIEAINARIAYGAIFIKEHEGLDDRGTVEYIMENPYAQYFLGLKEFKQDELFDSSMMVHFRKRFPAETIDQINRKIFEPEAQKEIEKETDDNDDNDDGNNNDGNNNDGGNETTTTRYQQPTEKSQPQKTGNHQPKNKGKLILDATISPSDIRYPNDLSLLNEARENLEQMIEELWQYGDRQGHKTGYYRKKARKGYLTIAKQKKPSYKKIRKAIGDQLGYINKNIDTVGQLLLKSGLGALPEKKYKRIMTICELYRQQQYMHKTRTHSCEGRIVSLRQPHIRPMVRGKAGKPYEFGQKIAASVIGGYTFIDRQSYDAFNEGIMLKESIEQYRIQYGHYPKAVLVDKIYRNRENLRYCKEHGIRISGPRLGRPKNHPTASEKHQASYDNGKRNTIEGRFGVSKRRFGLGLIMSYLPETGKTEAALQIFCLNISRRLKLAPTIIFSFFKRLFPADFSLFFHRFLHIYRFDNGLFSRP